MTEYYSIVTNVGAARITNAALLGQKVDITHFAVGDGGGAPEPGMTALKNEIWRGSITEYAPDDVSPNLIRVRALLPSSVGGFTIRELGVFDSEGNLIAAGSTPDTPKLTAAEGVSSEMELTLELLVSNSDVLQCTVDPTVIIATKAEVQKLAAKLATAATLGADGKLLDGQIPGADKVPLAVEGMVGTVQAGIAELRSGKMSMPTEIPNSADLNDYITPGLFYNGTSSGKIINLPVLSHAFSLLVEKTYAFHFGIKQTLTDYFNGATYLRTNYVDVTGTWRPWVQLATATPPQEYALPLAAGITGGGQSKYYKDQFGYVHVHGSLLGTFVWDTPIAQLPEGFRSARFMEFSATFLGANSTSSVAGCVNTDSNGEIRAFPYFGATCARAFFDCCYRAAN